jgi:signal transduction histidine kinase
LFIKKEFPLFFISLFLILFSILNLALGRLEKNEIISNKSTVELFLKRETGFEDSYSMARRIEDLERFNITMCSRLNIRSQPIVYFDYSTNRTCLLLKSVFGFEVLSIKNIQGTDWDFSYIIPAHIKYLVLKLTLSFALFLIAAIIYQFFIHRINLRNAKANSRNLAFEQIIHDINSPLQQLEKSLDSNSAILNSVYKVTSILNSYKNLHRLNSIFRFTKSLELEINEKKLEYPQAQFETRFRDIKHDWILMNPVVFKRVISNLINNAIEASSTNNQIITIATSRADNMIAIDISDTGKGISIEQVKNFGKTKFSTKGKNRGFGTTFSREALEKVGGSLQVLQTSSSGTTIRVLIPLLEAPKRLIHIEDDKYIIAEWAKSAKKSNMEYLPFKSFEEFNKSNLSISKTDYFFVDKNLSGKDGIDCAVYLNKKLKVKNIWLASAFIGEETNVPSFIKGSIGKEFPFS